MIKKDGRMVIGAGINKKNKRRKKRVIELDL
jgi:hypothetical protein